MAGRGKGSHRRGESVGPTAGLGDGASARDFQPAFVFLAQGVAALRNGAKSSAIPSSPPRFWIACYTTPSSSRSKVQAIGCASIQTLCPSTSGQSPTSNPRPYCRPCAGGDSRRKTEASISPTADPQPARLGNFTSALLGKIRSAFTRGTLRAGIFGQQRGLSSLLHFRRRPTPVKTSRRRTGSLIALCTVSIPSLTVKTNRRLANHHFIRKVAAGYRLHSNRFREHSVRIIRHNTILITTLRHSVLAHA
jgi:hypothetical protein